MQLTAELFQQVAMQLTGDSRPEGRPEGRMANRLEPAADARSDAEPDEGGGAPGERTEGRPDFRFDGRTPVRRSEPRVGLRATGTILRERCDDGGVRTEPLRIHVTDLSWGGLGFTARFAMRRGDTFLLHLPCDGGPDLLVKYVIMHAQPVDQGRLNAYGCKAVALYVVGVPVEHAFASDENDVNAHRISHQMRKVLEEVGPVRKAG